MKKISKWIAKKLLKLALWVNPRVVLDYTEVMDATIYGMSVQRIKPLDMFIDPRPPVATKGRGTV